MFNNKPSFNNDRSKDNTLGYAGRTISGQGNRVDRNYLYQGSVKRDDPPSVDMGNFFRNNPQAFDRYQQNLQKMNENKSKMDEYSYQMKGRQGDLFGKLRDIEGAKKLNEMNAQKHNDYLSDQLDGIRNYKPLKRNFSSGVTKPNIYNGYGNSLTEGKEYYRGDDNSMKLLDDYSVHNNLNDPFSIVARGRSGGGLHQNQSLKNVGFDDSAFMQDTIDPRMYQKGQYDPNYQNPNGGIYVNPMYPQPQQNQYPYNPYMPQMNQYGYPMGGMNPYQVFYPPYLLNQPGGGYYPQPMPPQDDHSKKETDIISAHIEKQARILEALSKRLDDSPRDRKRSRGSSRDFERRMKEIERENELKIQLLKQKQVIENLTGQGGGGNSMDPNGLMNGMMGNGMGQLTANNNFNPMYYQQQIQQLQQLTQMQQLQMQQMQQQQQELLMNQQYDYVPDYGGVYNPKELAPPEDKKKKKKKKKDSSDEDDVPSDTESKKNASKTSKPKEDDTKSVKSTKKDTRRDSQQSASTSVSKASTIQGFESPKKKRRLLLRKMRVLCWTMTYPMLLARDVKERVDNRKNKQMNILDTTASTFLQSMSFYMMNACQNGFVEVFKDAKKTYDFIGVKGKKPTDRQKDERINMVLGRITKLCDLLFMAAEAELDKAALEFLAQICLGEKYCPDYVLTTFELKRLEFNAYGRLLSMTKENARMVLICSAIVRILIFRMVLRAKDWNQKIKFTETLELNLLILASVFYMIIGKFLAERNTVLNRDMREVAPKPALPLLATEETPAADPYKTDEMIVGLYPWDDVSVVFLADYQPWIDTITNLIERWSEKMYQRVLEHRKDNPLPKTSTDD